MYPRHWLYVTAMSIGAFAIGICMTSVIRWPAASPAAYLLLIGIIIAIVASACRTRGSGRPQARRILCDIHRQVALLTEDGYELLIPRPHSKDTETVWLRIGVDHNGTAYIEREGWDGALRRYSISEDGGTVRRSVLGDNLTHDDYAWCHSELTDERLRHLLGSLTRAYAPLQSVAQQ